MSTVNLQDNPKLPVAERTEIVEAMWDSIAASPQILPITEPQKRELDRRLVEHRATPQSGRASEDIRDSLDES